MNVRFYKRMLLTLFLIGMISQVNAEPPQNREAVKWYNVALKSKSNADKIEAYKKAINADPEFAQAYYNLGIIYKRESDYEHAAEALQKAYSMDSGQNIKAIKFNSIFEIGRIYKSQKHYDEAIEAFQNADKLAPNNEKRSAIILELAHCYFRLDNFEQALSEAQKGLKLDSNGEVYFRNFIQAIEEGRNMSDQYEVATQEMSKGNLLEAKVLFTNIYKKMNDYKDVAARISQIDTLLKRKADTDILTALYDKAQNYENTQKYELALATYEQIYEKKKDYKDVAQTMEKIKNQIRIANQQDVLNRAYAEGTKAMNDQKWTKAIIAFERIIKEDPKFRDVARKLKITQANLEKENINSLVGRYYERGKQSMFARDWGSALVALEKVRSIDANYRDVQNLIIDVEGQLSSSLSSLENNTTDMESASMLDSLYTEAQGFIQSEDWFQASSTLEKIRIIKPGYRDVIDLLATARTNMALNQNEIALAYENQNTSGSMLFLGGAAFTLIFLPLIGFVVFVPNARARFFSMIGKHQLAATIYERLLQQNPGKLKFYPPLANAYLTEGRTDPKALQLFNTILKLNLNVPNRNKIEQIVQKKYLGKGSRSAEAIKAFESALKTKSR